MANYRSISIIRTSFSIVRPSIHIDFTYRHYRSTLFYSLPPFSFSFFFISFPFCLLPLLVLWFFFFLQILPTCSMTDRDFDQHITRIHSTCVNLFVCFQCNVYHFRCVLCICACSVYGCIRRYSYGRVQIDRCRNVRTKTRVCHVLFLFIYFFYSSFSYDFIKLDLGQKTIQRTIANMEKFYLIFWTERERISISNSLQTLWFPHGRSNVPHYNIQFYFIKEKERQTQ